MANDWEVKMNWSTQKNIRPPIRFAMIASDNIPHAGKENTEPGKEGCARLPAKQVEHVPFEIDPHTGNFGPAPAR